MMNWSQLLAPLREGSKTEKDVPVRTTFEQDYDRIIFSQPFRKLQDKTQVFPLPEDDFVHTRLTHSLEVSSVGRSLGRKVGEAVLSGNEELKMEGFSSYDFGTIVATASLAHDVGNPPFGHSGEQAISDFFRTGNGRNYKESISEAEWQDLINFEGNAQGFRILNTGSTKLTYPVLGAFSKYPRESFIRNTDASRKSQKKYGFFQTETGVFQEVASTLGLIQLRDDNDYMWCRHPLAFLVEAADDICYHIIDLEDGCTLGLVSEEETAKLLIRIVGDDFQEEKYRRIQSRQQRIGTLRAMAINKLVEESASVFIQNEENILNGKYDSAITESIDSREILREIIELSIHRLYQSKPVLQIEAAGFEVLDGLMNSFCTAMVNRFETKTTQKDKTLWRLIPEAHTITLSENSTTYEILRCCIDFIASMTDSFAISTYRKIKGISLSGF